MRDRILAASTIKSETVEVPEWGGTFTIRGMNAADRVEFFDGKGDGESKPARLGVLLLIECLRDGEGNRVLKPEDAPALEQQDGGLINRLCAVANRVNGLTTDAKEAAEKK